MSFFSQFGGGFPFGGLGGHDEDECNYHPTQPVQDKSITPNTMSFWRYRKKQVPKRSPSSIANSLKNTIRTGREATPRR